jgi:SPX domain protein involved in polyphosphate accumulation
MPTEAASIGVHDSVPCEAGVLSAPIARRYEIKLPLRNRTTAAVECSIRSHPMGFETLYPDRHIQNLYFDTPALSAFHASQAGLDRRVKLRLRWYGECEAPVAGQLEWKWRAGALGWKWQVPVAWKEELTKISQSRLRGALREHLDGRQRSILDAMAIPTLHNRYLRSYYVSRDGSVRLTRDRQLSFAPQTGGLVFQRRRDIDCWRMEVLEVKVDSARRADAARALAGFPYRPARFSKYGTGLELSLGTGV